MGLLDRSVFLACLGLVACGGATKKAPKQAWEEDALPRVVETAANGFAFDPGFKYWRLLTVTHRVDEQTLQAVLGNDTALRAASQGQTNPWPDGTAIANVVWKQTLATGTQKTVLPAEFVRVDMMKKDITRYADNNTGWAWARWEGPQLIPYGNDATFQDECITCHTKVSGNDWVFSLPIKLP